MTDVRRIAAPLVACLAGLLLVSCGDEEVGVAEAAPGISIEGQQSFLQLPHGRLSFQVTDAEQLDDGDARATDTTDGRFVGVDWTWEPGEGVPHLLSGFLIADDVDADVRVQIDGDWHDLGPAYDTSGGGAAGSAFFVPADDDVVASDVTVAVDFDGVEQTVRGDGSDREAGDAAGLYDLTWDPATPPCPAELSPRTVTGEATCEAAFVELPYVTDLGWAASGTSWVVADVTVTVPAFTVGGEEQQVVKQSETTTLDGADPAAVVLNDLGSGGVLRTQSVFAGDTGAERQLTFTRTLTTSQGGDVAEVRGDVTVPAG